MKFQGFPLYKLRIVRSKLFIITIIPISINSDWLCYSTFSHCRCRKKYVPVLPWCICLISFLFPLFQRCGSSFLSLMAGNRPLQKSWWAEFRTIRWCLLPIQCLVLVVILTLRMGVLVMAFLSAEHLNFFFFLFQAELEHDTEVQITVLVINLFGNSPPHWKYLLWSLYLS